MSLLHKDLFKQGKLSSGAAIPRPVPTPSETEGTDVANEQNEDATAANLPSHDNAFTKPRTTKRRDYSGIGWEGYFDRAEDLKIPNTNDVFRLFQIRGTSGPTFVMHHGAGHSALSFGLCAGYIKKISKGACSIMAYDCRGHGETKTEREDDLSLNTLSQDCANVVSALYGDHVPEIVLVGHSMGGAVVGDVAFKRLIPSITGLAIIDVVEGSAMESLAYMLSFLETRPKGFASINQAVEWAIRSGTIHNLESARLSIPPQLIPCTQKDAETQQGHAYRWRTDLKPTERFWTEWFTGLSEKFLNSRVAKLLILAGTDRLDKALTIGQMQGKFQLLLLPNSGHTIQEDEPDRVGMNLYEFMKRNEKLVLPKKVGQV